MVEGCQPCTKKEVSLALDTTREACEVYDGDGARVKVVPYVPMVHEVTDEVLGVALRGIGSTVLGGGRKVAYVSVGHALGLPEALSVVVATCGPSQVPEPLRWANIYARAHLRDHFP
jgi:deoxyinosine 3'endonuclease (endonuclease V)